MRVVVAGASGALGAIVVPALGATHDVVALDLPEHDLRDYETVRRALAGADVVVHSALIGEAAKFGNLHPDNVVIDVNILEAVIAERVGRLIFVSSTHVDTFDRSMVRPVRAHLDDARPTTPYGARKRVVEIALKTLSARHGFDAVAIRSGAVSRSGRPNEAAFRFESWLSHGDLVRAISAAVEAEFVPGRFEAFYAVSLHPDPRYSSENSFGWVPQDRLDPETGARHRRWWRGRGWGRWLVWRRATQPADR